MIQCHNCQKEYKKAGLSRHLSYCLKKFVINIDTKKEPDTKIIPNNYFEQMPDEIMNLIYSYIIPNLFNNNHKIDKFRTIASYYKELVDISRIYKRFYFLFNINKNTEEFKKTVQKSIQEQNDKNICKTTVKNMYPVKDSELEDKIPYKLVKNPHYRCAAPMKIYREIDIINFLREKYGSYREYLKIIEEKKLDREKRNEKKSSLEIKRKAKYDALFEKYGLLDNLSDNNNKALYDKYYDYIIDVKPAFAVIEQAVIAKYEYNLRCTRVAKYLLENHLQKMKSPILDGYIENNYYEFETAMLDIENKNKRRIELCNLLADNNIFYSKLCVYEKKCADDYIYRFDVINDLSLTDTLDRIKNIIERRNNIDEILNKLSKDINETNKNIKTYANSLENKKIEKYIEKDLYQIEEIYKIILGIYERIKRMNDINARLRKENIDINSLNNREEFMIEDYINKNIFSIDEIINTIQSKNMRKEELIKRLREHNLELRDDSEICKKYIEYAEMQIDKVVNIMLEMDFYYTHTNYSVLYKYHQKNDIYYNRSLDYHYKSNSIKISENAKDSALRNYLKKFEKYEDALLDNAIPHSLYENIKSIFENKIINYENIQSKCSCNNIASPICGKCSKCCNGCKRHIIKNNSVTVI